MASVLAGVAVAKTPDALYPAAQCAAFWLGRDDYARRSAYLDRDPGDVARAEAFRAEAVRSTGETAREIDRFIAEQRPLMAFLAEAYIVGGDEQSRDIHDRLAALCADPRPQRP